jgi:hypothetical protein
MHRAEDGQATASPQRPEGRVARKLVKNLGGGRNRISDIRGVPLQSADRNANRASVDFATLVSDAAEFCRKGFLVDPSDQTCECDRSAPDLHTKVTVWGLRSRLRTLFDFPRLNTRNWRAEQEHADKH